MFSPDPKPDLFRGAPLSFQRGVYSSVVESADPRPPPFSLEEGEGSRVLFFFFSPLARLAGVAVIPRDRGPPPPPLW